MEPFWLCEQQPHAKVKISKNIIYNLSNWHRIFCHWSQSFRQKAKIMYVKNNENYSKKCFSKLVSFLKYHEERPILSSTAWIPLPVIYGANLSLLLGREPCLARCGGVHWRIVSLRLASMTNGFCLKNNRNRKRRGWLCACEGLSLGCSIRVKTWGWLCTTLTPVLGKQRWVQTCCWVTTCNPSAGAADTGTDLSLGGHL